MLNSFDPQTTVLDWDLEDDGSPIMDQVPILLLPLSILNEMNIKGVPLFIAMEHLTDILIRMSALDKWMVWLTLTVGRRRVNLQRFFSTIYVTPYNFQDIIPCFV